MPIIYKGKEITEVWFNGTKLDHIYCNGIHVFPSSYTLSLSCNLRLSGSVYARGWREQASSTYYNYYIGCSVSSAVYNVRDLSLVLKDAAGNIQQPADLGISTIEVTSYPTISATVEVDSTRTHTCSCSLTTTTNSFDGDATLVATRESSSFTLSNYQLKSNAQTTSLQIRLTADTENGYFFNGASTKLISMPISISAADSGESSGSVVFNISSTSVQKSSTVTRSASSSVTGTYSTIPLPQKSLA